MAINKSKAGDILATLHVHKPARSLYRLFFGLEGRRRRKQLTDFYAPLIKPGDLVYDVGANIGVYSEIFCFLGARVVAFEPVPDCVRQLRRWLPSKRVTVIEASVGAVPGIGRLHISNVRSSSSMSDDWVRMVENSLLSKNIRWINELDVRVVTLDDMFGQYGKPEYVKIDVEGYEESVLDGMSWQPNLLSFEFHKETIEAALRCLSKPCISKDSLFNYITGELGCFAYDEWVSLDRLTQSLSELDREHGFGDIFVRRR